MKKLFATLGMFVLLVSCGGGASENKGDLKSITFNLSAEGKTLDSTLATDSPTLNLHNLVSEGLTTTDKDGKVVAGLAESYEVADDNVTWTFHLRDGIKWSNGDPITANDFKFAWLRALDPATAAEYAYMLYYIKGAEAFNGGNGSADDVAIKVVDDKTLVVELNAPTPYFASLVGFVTYLPINEKFLTEKGDEYALEADTMLYSGPFTLENWDHNASMKLVKNPNYYGVNNINLDEVNVKFIDDSGSALNAFKNEEIDIHSLTPEQLEGYKDSPLLNPVRMAVVWYIEMNTAKESVLSNVHIRRALYQAIDREDMVNNVFKGVNAVANNLTPAKTGMMGISKDFVEELGPTMPAFDPENAKKELAMGLAELGLTELPKISIITNDGGTNKKTTETIQEYLRTNLGVELEIELMTFKERLGRMQAKDFDIVLAGWGADYQDPMTFLDLFVTGGGNNHTSYSNAEYDSLIATAKATNDQSVRVPAMQEVERILGRDLPIGTLNQTQRNYILSDKFTGVQFPAFGADIDLRFADVK